MHRFCPLASGSKGNCLYLETPHTKILIDAGIGVRATKQKLQAIGVDLADIDAILVTHEHGDHIQGLKTLSFPVFANAGTVKGIIEAFDAPPKFKIFTTGDTFEFQDLQIHPFSIQHDTVDPVAFTVTIGQTKIGICTDLGFASSLVEHNLQHCDYLYLEANHEPDMVMASARPQVYKQRVLGRHGHLSNEHSGKLLARVAHEGLKHVFLAHLSSECNHPQKALQVVKSCFSTSLPFTLSIAPQESIAELLSW